MPKPREGAVYTALVTANGSPLAADTAALLASVVVDSTRNAPDLFVLRFSDNEGEVLKKAGLHVGVPVRISVQAGDSSAPKVLLDGEVTAVETEIDATGTHVLVRGFDKAHRLFRGRRVKTYVKMTAGDIAKKLGGDAGLPVRASASSTTVHEHVAQNAISDWELLTRLAGAIGAEVKMVDGTLQFRDATAPDQAPSTAQDAGQNAFVLEKDRNIITMRATVTAADQVPRVEVRGWDPKQKRATVGTAVPRTSSAQLSTLSPAAVAASFSSPDWIESDSRFTVQGQCEARAEAVADRLAGSLAELECVLVGNPDLCAGAAVALTNVGEPFDGKYTVTSARHEFSPDCGYRTHVTVSNASDRSLFGVAAGAGPGAGRPGQMDGVMIGIVSSAKDPEQLGRVQVQLPMLSGDYVSHWCRVLQFGAGQGRGLVWLPEVGDEVLVAFGQGHVDDPYVLGGIYNGKDKPKPAWSDVIDGNSGQVTRRALVSRTGMSVELLESSASEVLTISTNQGAHKIALSQTDKKIEIVSEGPVSVTAKQDVQVRTDSGSVSIKGNKVQIEATTDLVLKGASVTAQAQAAAELSGASVKVAGQASAELSASGVATVKAPLVKIN